MPILKLCKEHVSSYTLYQFLIMRAKNNINNKIIIN